MSQATGDEAPPWGRPVWGERAARRAEAYVPPGWWQELPYDRLTQAAARWPAAAAAVTEDRSVSFVELDRMVAAAAADLIGSGIGPSDAVLVASRNDVASLVAIHAVLRSGAVALLVLDSAGPAHLSEVIAQATPSLALAPDDWPPTAELQAAVTWRRSSDLSHVSSGVMGTPTPRHPDAPAVVIFTSGSTARPKGVVHSLNTITASGHNFAGALSLGPASGLFVVSPMATVTGLLHAVVVPPLIGARAVLVDGWDPQRALDLLIRTGPTFFGGPDVLLDRILEEARRRGVDRVPLTGVCVGGSMTDRRILDRAESDYGVTAMPSYGSSEAPVTCAASRFESQQQRFADEGPPLGGVELRIGSAGDPAECCLRGPHLFLGYVDPELDEQAFDDGWYRTGDRAELKGGRLRVAGRIRDIVIRNGLKVPVAEVEAAVAHLPGVLQAAGYSCPDLETGERLGLAVRLAPGAEIGLAEIVDGLLEAGLAKWKLPEEVVIWDEPFPETASGKVHRPSVAAGSTGSTGRLRLVAARLSQP